MSPNRYDITSLLRDLSGSTEARSKNLIFPSAEKARFYEPASGYSLWEWEPPSAGDKGRLTYVFRDQDGAGAFLTISASQDGNVKEIEFWRGDGKSLIMVPNFLDLEKAEPGRTY